jgi:hypothetical protein
LHGKPLRFESYCDQDGICRENLRGLRVTAMERVCTENLSGLKLLRPRWNLQGKPERFKSDCNGTRLHGKPLRFESYCY